MKMGLRIAEEADFYPPTPIPTNANRLTAWMMLQSNQTKANLFRNDISFFNQHGAFPPRSVFLLTPIILRIESHNASNSHLFPGIRRPHIEIHPLSAQSLPELIAVLVQQVSNYPISIYPSPISLHLCPKRTLA